MQRFSMVATETFECGGLAGSSGDIIENLTPAQAAMLTYQKVARFATPEDYVKQQMEPEREPDLAPEPTPTPDEEPTPPLAATTRRKRRTYRRRDMQAE